MMHGSAAHESLPVVPASAGDLFYYVCIQLCRRWPERRVGSETEEVKSGPGSNIFDGALKTPELMAG